jgi:predicted Zn-dependent protease
MMIEKIKGLIGGLSGVDDWKITETDRESLERYYLGRSMDMARGSRVREYAVCLFSDASDAAGKTRGAADCVIRPGMSETEAARALELCLSSASKSRGTWYPLLEKNRPGRQAATPALAKGKMEEWASRFADAFYSEDSSSDSRSDARINSLELFIRRKRSRIVNSRGLDENFESAEAMCEYIVQAKGPREEVEVYRESTMGRFDEASIRSELALQLRLAADRSRAKGMNELGASLKGLPVIISGSEAMSQYFGYYVARTDARNAYDGASDAAPGYRFSQEGDPGDAMNLAMAAFDERIPAAEPVDSDGLALSDLSVIEDGKVLSLHGEAKYCQLLGLAPRGGHKAARVSGGSLSGGDLRSGEHIECVSFSDFSLADKTGDFGGEIRLGYYSKGGERIPFSGGALSGNVAENARGLKFSRETALAGNLIAPECLRLPVVSVSGDHS